MGIERHSQPPIPNCGAATSYTTGSMVDKSLKERSIQEMSSGYSRSLARVSEKSVSSLSVLLLSQTAWVSRRPSCDCLMGFKPGRGSSVSKSGGRTQEESSA